MENITVTIPKHNTLGGRYKTTVTNLKRLTNGNAKLYGILIFDLPAIYSCRNCKDCKDSCYAVAAQTFYPYTWSFRFTNLHLAAKQPELLRNLINAQLKTAKQPYIRIHSSGEFFSQKYVDLWVKIVKANPLKQFYTYTKMLKKLDFSVLLSLPNFNLVSSTLPNGALNYGNLEYCKAANKQYDAFICPCGLPELEKTYQHSTPQKDSPNGRICGFSCTACTSKKHVVFKFHGNILMTRINKDKV
jgi:hypothetical protein